MPDHPSSEPVTPPSERLRLVLAAILLGLAGLLAACSESGRAADSATGSAAEASASGSSAEAAAQERPRYVLVMHGGVGTLRPEDFTPQREREYRDALTRAIGAGHEILRNGGASLDAVEAAIRVLEDSPLFNAGKGAVFTNAGTNELDASIMDGRTRNAGAVAGVKHVKNPISLARLVMERSKHVMLAGEGAEAFARENGIELVPADYFHTDRRWRALERAREQEAEQTSAAELHLGTVGAVALDARGDLAAGTSTGGLTNKRWGRIGDSPIIGAGTYANNESCAVSGTGTGEFFIRNAVAHDICARVRYRGTSLEAAARKVIQGVLVEQGADGGVVALDGAGSIAMVFNTEGMYRGYVRPDGRIVVEIFGE